MTVEIPGYEDLTEVGRGGFAVVYRAHQVGFDRTVAVKVLSRLNVDERTRRRFERECRVMGALSWHPHIVVVYDSGVTAEGQPFLVMEYMKAGSLGDRRQQRGPLAEADVLRWAVQVAGALQSAHDAGVLHRDLKPENVLLDVFGQAKLGDFGIASVAGSYETTTGSASFTVIHAAPEVINGLPATARSDLYSFGSMLYQLLTGSAAFRRDTDESVTAILLRVVQEPVPDLRPAGVADDLAGLIEALMAKDPDRRPATAAEVGEALQAIERSRGRTPSELLLHSDPDGVDVDGGPAGALPADDEARVVTRDAPGAGVVATGDPNATIDLPRPPVPMSEQPPAPPAAEPAELVHPTSSPVAEPPGGTQGGAATEADAGSGGGGGRRRGLLVVAGVVVLLVVIVGALLRVTGGGGDDSGGGGDDSGEVAAAGDVGTDPADRAGETSSTPTTVPLTTDPTGTTTVAPVGAGPRGVAVGEGAVWVANSEDGTVSRVSLDATRVEATIAVGQGPRAVAVGEGAVWVTVANSGTLVRIDPDADEVVAEIPVGVGPSWVSVNEVGVWVANLFDDTVTRVDPGTDEVLATITVGDGPSGITLADGSIWVANFEGESVSEVDPATNEVVSTISVDVGPGGITTTDGRLWVADAVARTVSAVDLGSRRVIDVIAVDAPTGGISTDGASVFVTLSNKSRVLRFDVGTATESGRFQVGDGPRAIAVAGGAIYTADFDVDTLTRVVVGV